MSKIIALVIEYLPHLVKAAKSVPEIITFINKTKETLKQTKEWSAADEVAFDKYEAEITSQEHWNPENTLPA